MRTLSRARRVAVAAALVGCSASLAGAAAPASAKQAPLRLHPDNPHYFEFRGKPTTLIASGEHYGAVLNLDFDYRPYLKALQRDGFNVTRIFSGAYVERDSSIPSLGYRNTLAPRPGRFLAPWARSSTPGYAAGGNKFDLERWDPAYFKRLNDFVAEAARRGIAVEMTFFSTFYGDGQWTASPMNAANNVNGIGDVLKEQAYSLGNAELLRVQDELTRKIVTELNRFDNVYFEPVNEPDQRAYTPHDWEAHIIQTIADTDRVLPKRHLIAQNVNSGFGDPWEDPDAPLVENPNPLVSIFNFHAPSLSNKPGSPALQVDLNLGLDRPLGDDETGGPMDDGFYRREGWEFMLAGGAVFNNLDWSFTPGHEDGSDVPLGPGTPGSGGPTLRRQIAGLADFLDRLPLVRMRPDDSVVEAGVPAGARAQALVSKGRAYGIYVVGDGVRSLRLRLPAGRYRARWIDPKTGVTVRSERVRTTGGGTALDAPAYSEDVALRVLRTR